MLVFAISILMCGTRSEEKRPLAEQAKALARRNRNAHDLTIWTLGKAAGEFNPFWEWRRRRRIKIKITSKSRSKRGEDTPRQGSQGDRYPINIGRSAPSRFTGDPTGTRFK